MRRAWRPLAAALALAIIVGACARGDVTAPADAAATRSGELATALEEVTRGTAPPNSVVVQRHGEVMGEAYAPGFGPDTPQPVYSITKSVVSLLIGIAVDEGLLDLDTTLTDVLGDDVVGAHPDVTIEHLLTMTSGLFMADSDNGVRVLYASSDDWVAAVLAPPSATPPGSTFSYCSGCAHLLAAALDRATGGLPGWANERLAVPLGAEPMSWELAGDGSQLPIGGWGMALTARQLARLGQLYLDGGRCEGQQVVAASRVRDSVTPQVTVPTPFEPWTSGYGYLWWTAPDGVYAATGHGGQIVLVVPDLDLVVAATADLPGETAAGSARFVWDRIVEPITTMR